MESKQKYTEAELTLDRSKDDLRFDDYFIDDLLLLPYEVSMDIMNQLARNHMRLPMKMGWPQLCAGVVKGKNPYFFEIEFLKESLFSGVVFLYIDEITCDEYLDYINKKQQLK